MKKKTTAKHLSFISTDNISVKTYRQLFTVVGRDTQPILSIYKFLLILTKILFSFSCILYNIIVLFYCQVYSPKYIPIRCQIFSSIFCNLAIYSGTANSCGQCCVHEPQPMHADGCFSSGTFFNSRILHAPPIFALLY